MSAITTAIADLVYNVVVKRPTPTARRSSASDRTTINHAMKSCRRAPRLDVAARAVRKKVPLTNPFATLELVGEPRDADSDL